MYISNNIAKLSIIMNNVKRPLTLRDVSEAAKVSEMTVSRVLRSSGDVSEATRQKVLNAAKTLGYVPNRIAGALASKQVNLVAVIVPSMSNMVFPEVLTGVTEALNDTELQPVIGITNYETQQEEKILYEMLSWRPSGLIIAGLDHSPASAAMLKNAGIPVVEIMDVDGKPIDSIVGISHRRAGREMAGAILKAGYRAIGFMGTKMPLDLRARKRFEGFTEVLAKHGVEVTDHEFYHGGSALAKGKEMTATMLKRTPELDFLYYSNDMIAAGGLLYLIEQGIKIPDQIGLAGFNALDILDGLPKQVATMDACRYEIGFEAAKIIVNYTKGDTTQTERMIELTPKISYGNTLKRRL